jgi:hypothetical protein
MQSREERSRTPDCRLSSLEIGSKQSLGVFLNIEVQNACKLIVIGIDDTSSQQLCTERNKENGKSTNLEGI